MKQKGRAVMIKTFIIFLVIMILPRTNLLAFKYSYGERDKINDKEFQANWEKPIVVYGDGLKEEEIERTFELLNIKNKEDYQFLEVFEFDLFSYVNALFITNISSATIKKEKSGTGVKVNITTPENITMIEDYEYSNAAITSGISDCTIEIVSVRPATGQAALAGIFKAFKLIEPELLNEDAAKISVKELELVTKLKKDLKLVDVEQDELSKQLDALTSSSSDENNEELETKSSEEILKERKIKLKDLGQAILDLKIKIAENRLNNKLYNEDELKSIADDVFRQNNFTLDSSTLGSVIKWANEFQGLNIDWQLIGKRLGDFDKQKVIEKTGEKSSFNNSINYGLIIGVSTAVLLLIVLLISLILKGKNKKRRNR